MATVRFVTKDIFRVTHGARPEYGVAISAKYGVIFTANGVGGLRPKLIEIPDTAMPAPRGEQGDMSGEVQLALNTAHLIIDAFYANIK